MALQIQNLTISHFQFITNPLEAYATTYVYTVRVDETSVPYKDADLTDTNETLVNRAVVHPESVMIINFLLSTLMNRI